MTGRLREGGLGDTTVIIFACIPLSREEELALLWRSLAPGQSQVAPPWAMTRLCLAGSRGRSCPPHMVPGHSRALQSLEGVPGKTQAPCHQAHVHSCIPVPGASTLRAPHNGVGWGSAGTLFSILTQSSFTPSSSSSQPASLPWSIKGWELCSKIPPSPPGGLIHLPLTGAAGPDAKRRRLLLPVACAVPVSQPRLPGNFGLACRPTRPPRHLTAQYRPKTSPTASALPAALGNLPLPPSLVHTSLLPSPCSLSSRHLIPIMLSPI